MNRELPAQLEDSCAKQAGEADVTQGSRRYRCGIIAYVPAAAAAPSSDPMTTWALV